MPFPVLVGENAESSQPADRIITDEDAMKRLQTHNANALSVLFERYCKLVFSIAFRVLRDHGEAEDVVQEVFTYMYKKADLFDPDKASAKSWIVRTSFHRALNRRYYLTKRNFYGGTDIDSLRDTLSGEVDLERRVAARLTGQRLRDAFAELSEKQRLTLELVFFEGMELSEVAARLNEPVGNVRHYYYRARERLRRSVFAGGKKNGD